jgi:RNA polymerase subunit RPABC4/transcription elongation factor Spt4
MEEFLSWTRVEDSVVASWHQIFQQLFWEFSWWNDIWLVLGVLFCLWRIISLFRVIKDVNARSSNLGFQFLALVFVLVLTPVLGLPLYIACRPQWWKWDKTPRRQALLANLQVCENCQNLVPIDHDCCVSCGYALKVECRECSEYYASVYEYCPFCGAPHLKD